MLAERFHYSRSTGLADFAISSTGTLAYRTPPPPSRLVWLDREGIEVGRLGDEALYGEPRISADGARVAVDISDPAQGAGEPLGVRSFAGDVGARDVFPADERTPLWSRDGTALFYASDAAGPPDLYRRVLNSGRDNLLLKTEGIETPNDTSPDGLELLFHRPGRGTSGDLWRLRLDGTAQAAVLHQTPAGESSGRFSPDGRWVAYDSNESGRYEAYIQSIDNSGLRWKVSQGSGVNPEWGRNGTELFFVGTDSRLMSVPIRTTPSFQPGTPRPLFRISSPFYSVLPDASRFLVVEPGRTRRSPDQHHRQLAAARRASRPMNYRGGQPRSFALVCVEATGIAVSSALWLMLAMRAWGAVDSSSDIGLAGLALVAAYGAADWVSGLAHWFCDTFFEEDTAVIGPALIQPFREHHRDPLAMTRHGFLELNGNNCLGLVVPLAVAIWLRTCGAGQRLGDLPDTVRDLLLPRGRRDQSSTRVGACGHRTAQRPMAPGARHHFVARASRTPSPGTVCASLLRDTRLDESAARSREVFRTWPPC